MEYNGYTKMEYTTSNMTFGANKNGWEIPVKSGSFNGKIINQ